MAGVILPADLQDTAFLHAGSSVRLPVANPRGRSREWCPRSARGIACDKPSTKVGRGVSTAAEVRRSAAVGSGAVRTPRPTFIGGLQAAKSLNRQSIIINSLACSLLVLMI